MGETSATALVTGAAKRIGREIAIYLAEEGINVVIHYRTSEEEAKELRNELLEIGVKAPVLQADLKEKTDLTGLLPEANERTEGVDFLVNNAAAFPRGTLEELEFEDLIDNLRINTWAPFYLTRSFAETCEQGKIVNLLDTRIAGYDWDHAGYYFSKVLLARVTKMMALRFAPQFTVNAVAPGLITPPEGLDEDYLERRIDRVPLKEHGQKEDVARAVGYLLSSNFLTGQILYVDGGRNLLHELGG